MIALCIALVFLVGPAVVAFVGLRHAAREPQPATRWVSDWRLTLQSALLYTLAFNLTFFLQELWLVLPKAATPGLHPVLYHNNHSWRGDNPIAPLLQGSGALAILASGGVCMLLARHRAWRSRGAQLFCVWMAYCGVFESLPQVVVGALNPLNDVGMAMQYLQLSSATRAASALVALALMPLAAFRLTRDFLSLAETPQLTQARQRIRFIFGVVTLPALLGALLIIPYRMPREALEVIGVPAVVSVIGTLWIQACAWRDGGTTGRAAGHTSLAWPSAAAVALLLVFQLVLRRGIAF